MQGTSYAPNIAPTMKRAVSVRYTLSKWLICLLLVNTVGCGSRQAGQDNYFIKIKGSDTVLPIAQKFAEHHQLSGSNTEVSVTGGGSGVGIASLLERTTDIAMSSRDIKLSEQIRLQDRQLPYIKHSVAFDALALCVHPQNPIKQLTREQVEAIYTGAVRNWKALGGEDREIVVYSRESSSGTHEFFKEQVMDRKEFAPEVLMMPATGAIIQSVSQTRGAIGYVGLAYLTPEVKALAISYDKGKTYQQPSIPAAQARNYPIVRPLFFIYLAQDSNRLASFMHYVLSKQGQADVLALGFVPLELTSKP